MKRVVYTVLILILFVGKNSATEKILSNSPIPTSPETSSLGIYGAYPVNYNTGIPMINIPIYEFKGGNITLPISLSYHASGIKVDDIGSSVGLGWSLNAGGCIAVQVNGTDDYNYDDLGNICKKKIKSLNFDMFSKNNISIDTLRQLSSSQETRIDAEHDIYNFNINGNTGQFLIKDGCYNGEEVQFIKNSDGLSITFNANEKEFVVTDNYGQQYILKSIERTNCQNLIREIGTKINRETLQKEYYFRDPLFSTSSNHITAWYLTSIVDKNRLDTLKFVYQTSEQEYQTRISGYIKTYRTECDANYNLKYLSLFNNDDISLGYINVPTFNNQIVKNSTLYIKEIIHNRTGNKMVFSYSNREDLQGGQRVDKIAIVNGNDSLYSWDLRYTYGNSRNINKKRLKLLSVQKRTQDNQLENPYTFTYYHTNQETDLPPRNGTNGYDHWGYFNSLIENDYDASNPLKSFPKIDSVLVFASRSFLSYDSNDYYLTVVGTTPSITIPDNNSQLTALINEMGDRSQNQEYIDALSLREIRYPTGGSTVFYYEANKCNESGGYYDPKTFVSGLRIRRIVSKSNTNDSIVKSYVYKHGNSMHLSKPNYFSFIYNSDNQSQFSSSMGNLSGCMNFQNYPDFSNICYGELISYAEVEEIMSSHADQSRTVYKYEDHSIYEGWVIYEQIGVVNKYPFHCSNLQSSWNYRNAIQPFNLKTLGRSYKNGVLRNVKYFNNDELVKEEQLDYEFIDNNKIFSNSVKGYYDYEFMCNYYSTEPSFYFFDIYYYQTGKRFLTRKKEIEYTASGSDSIVKTILYTYDFKNELITQVIDSLEDKIITKTITYPFNYTNLSYSYGSAAPLQKMVWQHMINYPIEEKTFVNDMLTRYQFNAYSDFRENLTSDAAWVEPLHIYSLKINQPTNDFNAVSSGNGTTPYTVDSRLTKDVSYTYYPNGSLKEIIDQKTGLTTTYLWSYKGLYPIAEIKKATYENVLHSLPLNFLSNITSSAYPSNDAISSLHTALSQGLPRAQISTYTYKPLVGMTSQTDARGVTTYYNYDTFGRLVEVYQLNGGKKEILNAYSYNYAH